MRNPYDTPEYEDKACIANHEQQDKKVTPLWCLQTNEQLSTTLEVHTEFHGEVIYEAKHGVLSAAEVAWCAAEIDCLKDEIESFNQLMIEVALPAFLWLDEDEEVAGLKLHWQEPHHTQQDDVFANSLHKEASMLAHSLRHKTFSRFLIGQRQILH